MKNAKSRIFLNSLPKAGTHLAAKCLDLMGFQKAGGLDASLVLSRSFRAAVFQALFRTSRQTGFSVGVDMPVMLRSTFVNLILDRARAGQFINGHVGYRSDLLDHIKNKGFLPLLILRDPRSVLNSFVPYVMKSTDHSLHELFLSLNETDRYRVALHGRELKGFVLKPLVERCAALECWLEDEDVHLLRFETLVGESGGGSAVAQLEAIASLGEFLGVRDVQPDKVARDLFGPGLKTFRKGQIRGWQSEMPASIQSEANRTLEGVLKRWGYES